MRERLLRRSQMKNLTLLSHLEVEEIQFVVVTEVAERGTSRSHR